MTILEQFRQDPQRVLDRLVDGELAYDDRRRLLAALDDEPGAWRACGLAFLEAQSWQSELPRVASEPAASPVVSAPSSGPIGRRWASLLAIAAGLLVAFTLGTQFPAADPARQFAQVQPAPQATSPAMAPGTAEPNTRQKQAPAGPAAPPREQLASAGAPTGQSAADDDEDWTTLTLTPGEAAEADKAIELLVRKNAASDDSSTVEPSPVPEALLSQLEQAGWQVKRQQRLLPVDLSDGRRLVVPVEDVDVSFPEWSRF